MTRRPYKVVWRDLEEPTFVLASRNTAAKLRALEHRYGARIDPMSLVYTFGKKIKSCRQWAGPEKECVNWRRSKADLSSPWVVPAPASPP